MRAVQVSFRQMIAFLKRDMMLAAACVAPLLIGLAFRFAIPFLENVITEKISAEGMLTPFYTVFDLFLVSITPVFYCFIAAMVILEERDDCIMSALYVSPLGRGGYIFSRVGIPGIISFCVAEGMIFVFSLTEIPLFEQILLALCGTLQGIVVAILVVTLSSNKLEGMAVTKISGLLIMVGIVPWFVPENLQYVFWIFPSFWMGQAMWSREVLFIVPSLILSVIWISLLLLKGRTNRF